MKQQNSPTINFRLLERVPKLSYWQTDLQIKWITLVKTVEFREKKMLR